MGNKNEPAGGTIVFVTGNQSKFREVKEILGESFPYKITSKAIDLPEYQGESDEVSIMKCKSAYEIIKAPVIVDDTSLCCNALGGLPGPYVKCFLKKTGPGGLFKMLQGFDDYSATALATFAYCDGDVDSIKLFKGLTTGTIVSPRESNEPGFDVWDFQPDGYSVTYAEMSAEQKNQVSHRKKAVEEMKQFFSQNEK